MGRACRRCWTTSALTSGERISDVQAKQFGESAQSPMIARIVRRTSGAKGPREGTFVTVTGDGVVLQAMKPARFVKGTVLRLREIAGRLTTARVTVDGIPFERAFLCNLAEDKLDPLTVADGSFGGSFGVPCKPLGLTTVLLEP